MQRSRMSLSWNFRFGIVIIGDSAVGKSSLLHRYTEGTFDESRQSPLGIDFKVQHLDFDPGILIKLLLWDTAGQERFRSISKSYMRNSVGCILVFDISQRQSFEHIQSWHKEVQDYVKPATMIFLLVGHKSDLVIRRQVRKTEAEALAKELDMAGYIEVSSKDNVNVTEAFETLTREIYQRFQQGNIPLVESWYGLTVGMPLHESQPKTEKTGCNCG
ncbi:ras-related protein Rab-39A-like [Scleropages formosus]|uniref:Ras-related protein Rab-39A-like n=1 Tax=Scleropages formosus TaxID=113540 RepID=A0A0P7V005_SCLFO|nr:ras-related protein Rab-39A-like [Scleropages formosus]KPP65611.1 ras-related protein Rab-39A-like [Scleropages formosus]